MNGILRRHTRSLGKIGLNLTQKLPDGIVIV
jgi:hypothetical protein